MYFTLKLDVIDDGGTRKMRWRGYHETMDAALRAAEALLKGYPAREPPNEKKTLNEEEGR